MINRLCLQVSKRGLLAVQSPSVLGPLCAIPSLSIRQGSTVRKRGDKRISVPWKRDNASKEELVDASELARTMDFTVPSDKQAHVEALKKAIRGGRLSERSLYREVPTPDEMDAIKFTGNFIPTIAPNAEDIISFALSHIPERAGPRRSRHKKRMARKWEIKRAADAARKAQTIAAREAKHAKLNAHRLKVKKVLKQAKQMKKNDAHAAAVRAKLASAEAGS